MLHALHTPPFIDVATNYFDQLVPTATDDELFASGYLRGHFDLVVGTLEVAGDPFTASDILQQVNLSLQRAIDAGELTEQDQQHVNVIWQRLQQLAG